MRSMSPLVKYVGIMRIEGEQILQCDSSSVLEVECLSSSRPFVASEKTEDKNRV